MAAEAVSREAADEEERCAPATFALMSGEPGRAMPESSFSAEVWRRFTVHHTSKHGRWLNQAEIEIGLLARQCLRCRRIPVFPALRREGRAWNRRNRQSRTIKRQFKTGLPLANSSTKELLYAVTEPASKPSGAICSHDSRSCVTGSPDMPAA